MSDYVSDHDLTQLWGKVCEDESNWELDDLSLSQAIEQYEVVREVQDPLEISFDLGFYLDESMRRRL